MLSKIIKTSAVVLTLSSVLYAGNFNEQAEKDRLAMQKYFLKKFEDPIKNQNEYFPYVEEAELKKDYIYPVKLEDFVNGTGSWYKPTRDQMEEINEFAPYEIPLDEGRELWVKPFANGKTYSSCFPDAAVKQNFPYYDTKRDEVVTIGQAINECRVGNGEKPLKYGKGDIAKLAAHIAYESRGKEINIQIPNEKAAMAYEAGKKMFYKQRGYFYMNCTECHVQGAGKKVRQEALSPILGAVSHFPVYRIKWGGLGTLQRRLVGCVKDTGSEKPAMQSRSVKELEYFVTYMSNGLKLNGPDTRK
ncbi:sulfur oxidation c-type cytochrome SoxA [Sulfurospirillum sp.]|nr:sulfur oxidation c-type cytochrome SoxA [Sulfurospirillum sp.]